MSTPFEAARQSAYFDIMSDSDLKARALSNNKGDVLSTYAVAFRRPTVDEAETIDKATYNVDQLLKQRQLQILQILQILQRIEWSVWICSESLEGGMPHTHGKHIILPQNIVSQQSATKLQEILLHEKIHVFQRQYPILVNKLYLQYWGMKIIGRREALQSTISTMQTIRANPDNNHLIYADSSNKAIVSFYKSVQFPSLREVAPQRDHPNEMMAYMWTNTILQGVYKSKVKGDLLDKLLEWEAQPLIKY